MMRILVLATLCAALCCEARAHAFLDHARPPVCATVRASPAEVRLSFSEDLEPAFSTVKVLDKSGRQVDKQDKHADRRDPAVLTVSLPALAPGTYRVVWRVLSIDAHVTAGDFTFDVAP
jgi:copper resistance protein C